MQQEAAERTRGYKQRIMQYFNSSKPTVEMSEASGGSSIPAGSAVNLNKVSGGHANPLVPYGSTNGESGQTRTLLALHSSDHVACCCAVQVRQQISC